MTAILELQNVSAGVAGSQLLKNISLKVRAGERIVIAGPNGAGKTTLLRIISGALRPSEGRVLLNGSELSNYTPWQLAERRAVLSQHTAVTFPFTVREIVSMGADAAHTSVASAAVEDMLKRVDLANFGNRIITTLSGGEQQRTHIARNLIQAVSSAQAVKPLLLFDEPTSNLDLRHQLVLAKILDELSGQGHAVISVLHDLNLAQLFGGRLLILKNGAVLADGPVGKVLNEDLMRAAFEISGSVVSVPNLPAPIVIPHAATLLDGFQL